MTVKDGDIRILAWLKAADAVGDADDFRSGDRDRLKQVFLNLGSNAVKYSPEGTKIILSLYRKREWVEVVIRDEGYGIPKEELGRLFERFYRGDKSRTRSKRDVGYGLGLPIAKKITEEMGGELTFVSNIGEGSTFCVKIPILQ